MKLEEELLCGIKPVTLKKVFRTERFDTLRFMRIAGLGEPAASQTLHRLAQEGWVSFDENDDGVDWWTTTAQAERLSATRLIKRFPVRVGRAIVDDVVAEARRLNRDPNRSRRITSIYLFGSVLTGQDADLAGDIDLVAEVTKRKLPANELESIEQAELPDRTNHMQFMESLTWPTTSILRGLRKVSNKISLHGMHDLTVLGVPYRQVYAFDTEREAEVPFDPGIRKGERRAEIDQERIVVPPAKAVRPWPALEDPDAPVTLETEVGMLAEHLWVNGWDAGKIASRVHADVTNIANYLASRTLVTGPAAPIVRSCVRQDHPSFCHSRGPTFAPG